MADFALVGVLAQTRKLAGDVPKKGWVVAKIAPPETLWLLQESMSPLQTGAFDPVGAVADMASMEIEGRSYPDQERHLQ